MAMDELNTLAKDDGAEVRKEGEEVGEGGGGGDGGEGDVVYFERGEEVADSDAVGWVAVGYDDHLYRHSEGLVGWLVGVAQGRGGGEETDFVAPLDEVCAEHVDVAFYAAHIRVEEVTDHPGIYTLIMGI